jgi:ribosomal protein RSM22 (predicted rRNA methylase)
VQTLPLLLDSKLYKDSRLKESLGLLRLWMGPERRERPANYLNLEAYLNAYLAYYFPLHLPELYWILDQGKKRKFEFAPKRVLDVGCGPGTLTLSMLLWLNKEKIASPEEIVLWDQSERALKFAKDRIKKISTSRVRFETVHLPSVPREEKFDLILMGHLLNEWGAGPRFRDKKLALIKQLSNLLTDEGSLIIIEPPLREPTLDLMALRDRLIENFTIVAPCPQSNAGCPMLRDALGWCYAQPPRHLFKEAGFTEYDSKIEKLIHINMTHQSFSYLWITRKKAELKNVTIAVTDKKSPRHSLCVNVAEIEHLTTASAFRGEMKLEN